MFNCQAICCSSPGNLTYALVSAAILSCVSTYCYIACCDAAQAFVYRYFGDSVAAFSPLLYCWVVDIIKTTSATIHANFDVITGKIARFDHSSIT